MTTTKAKAHLRLILCVCLFVAVTSQQQTRKIVEVASEDAVGCRQLCVSRGPNCILAHFQSSAGLCYIYSSECGHPGNPTNGKAVAPGGTLYNATAHYTCDPGHTLVGPGMRSCLTNSSWSDLDPICNAVDCGPLGNPADGAVATPGGTTYTQGATYSCNAGYTMVGVATRTCLATAAWDGAAPSCPPVDCGPPATPVDGSVSSPGGTTYTQTASYTCNAGYNLVGSATATCQAGATWTAAPTCIIADCGALSSPVDGSVATPGGTTYQEQATFTCNTGFSLVGSVTLTCQASGSWSNPPPTCLIVDCGALSNPTDGSVATSGGTSYSEMATYACNTGYLLSGPATRTCLATGAWDGGAPACPPVDCLAPSQPAGGSVATPGGTTYTQVASYTCNTGYNIVGSATVTCQASAVWTAAPTCNIANCGPLSNPVDGSVATPGGTTYQQQATFTCNTGFSLAGSAILTCQASGSWSNPPPTCPIVNCGSVPNPTNGGASTSGGTTYNQVATFTCNTGYTLSTPGYTRTCQASGLWSGTTPGCNVWPQTTVNGVSWEAFWWYKASTFPAVSDVLQSAYGSCSYSASYCFGRLPSALVESTAEMLAIDGNGNQFIWAFDPNNAVAHQAWLAFHDHITGSTDGGVQWRPTVIAGQINAGIMDAFRYGVIGGTMNSLILDDNFAYCATSIEIGDSNGVKGVDNLYDVSCDLVSPTKELTFYFKL